MRVAAGRFAVRSSGLARSWWRHDAPCMGDTPVAIASHSEARAAVSGEIPAAR